MQIVFNQQVERAQIGRTESDGDCCSVVAGGKAEDDGTPAPETSRQGTGAGGIEQEASAVEPSHANSGESGSGAPRAAVAVGPPSLADVRQLELKVEELEKEAGALAPQVFACKALTSLYDLSQMPWMNVNCSRPLSALDWLIKPC